MSHLPLGPGAPTEVFVFVRVPACLSALTAARGLGIAERSSSSDQAEEQLIQVGNEW